MREGTLVAAFDGSYNCISIPEMSGAGWILLCKRTGKSIKGSLVEWSKAASSYQGKLLGMLAVHLMMLAV